MIEIRKEGMEDHDAIRRVNELAFEGEIEAGIVEALRNTDEFIISMVAIHDEIVVGHIFFSPVSIENREGSIMAMGLGPMSVLPDHQRQGIGSKLVEKGLEACKEKGYPLVVVLGHPEFYPRFGFIPSKPIGIECEWDVPEEVFMVVELEQGALDRIQGTVKYHEAFDE
jgi:putative acetyltransferase